MNIPQSRTISFIIVAIVYVFATLIGVVTYQYSVAQMPALWALFVADFILLVLLFFLALAFFFFIFIFFFYY